MLALPPAKINLGLNVVRKRPDGYHDIETVFYPIPLRDVLEIEEARDGAEDIQIVGMGPDDRPEDNLVYRVYSDMRSAYALPPLRIYLCKHIPTGAGLGGGSSDAAETMKLINDIFGAAAGDRLLQGIAAIYQEMTGNRGVCARLNADQFACLL